LYSPTSASCTAQSASVSTPACRRTHPARALTPEASPPNAASAAAAARTPHPAASDISRRCTRSPAPPPAAGSAEEATSRAMRSRCGASSAAVGSPAA
jgi:hypothetical protein